MDVTEKRYRQADVLRAVAGLDVSRLQQWLNRRLLIVGDHSPGSGRARKWSIADVIQVASMVELARFGVTPSFGAKIGKDIAEKYLSGPDRRLKHVPGDQLIVVWWDPHDQGFVYTPTDTNAPLLDHWDGVMGTTPVKMILNIDSLKAAVLSRLPRPNDK